MDDGLRFFANGSFFMIVNMELAGTLPREISVLEDLASFSLEKNHLYGSLPASLADLEHLNFFDFQHNNFTGSVPSRWWTSRPWWATPCPSCPASTAFIASSASSAQRSAVSPMLQWITPLTLVMGPVFPNRALASSSRMIAMQAHKPVPPASWI